MRFRSAAIATVVLAVGASSLVACSSSGGSGGNNSTGPITFVTGKDNSNWAPPRLGVECRPPEREGDDQAAVRPGRPAAVRPRAALPGQGRRLRRRHRRRGLDRRVRRQGLAHPAHRQVRPRHQAAAARDGQGRDLQRHAVRRAVRLRRRPAVLPQGPRPDPADHLDAAHRRLQGQDGQHDHRFEAGLLRRPVRQVRGPDRQRGRGHQRRRRRDRRRRDGKTPDVNTGAGSGRPELPGQRLQAGLHPQGSHRLPGDAEPERLRGRQAGLHAQLAVRRRHPVGQTSKVPASSASRRCRARTVTVRRAWAVTAWRSASTPSTRRPTSTS